MTSVSQSGLEVRSLTVIRGGRPVVREVSLRVEPGKITALLGPNGAGKSSLVLAISGMLPVESGEILLNGRNLAGSRPEMIRRSGIAAVPEGHQVLTRLSVQDNLAAAGSALSRNDLSASIEEAYTIFPELVPLARQEGKTLSGGQQQMVALAQAIIGSPAYILVDEMSLGLAPLIVQRLTGVVETFAQKGIGVLLIEQFTTVALRLAHHVYVLDRGQIRFDGSSEAVRERPEILQNAYLAGEFT